MCGISGAVAANPGVAEQAIAEQIACQRHRGSDAEGFFAGGRGVIAQNRLVDHRPARPAIRRSPTRTAGSAPSSTARSTTSASCARSCGAPGTRSRARGDTEVIAHLAEDHEAVALARQLDGMFAFAIWDQAARAARARPRSRSARSRCTTGASAEAFVFGSEIKGVLAHPAVPRELDPSAHLGRTSPSATCRRRDTFFAGIESLPPGHVLTLEPGGEPRRRALLAAARSRASTAVEPLDLALDEAAAQVRDGLREAIRRRLVADVPLGAFLSGGIDSSAIVALMAGEMDRSGARPSRSASRTTRASTSGRSRAPSPSGSGPSTTRPSCTPRRSTWSSGSSGITTSRSATRARSPPSC